MPALARPDLGTAAVTAQAERRSPARPTFASATVRATLGVVVVAHDDERHLDRLLQSLRGEAAGTAMRVVVVDNGSTDGTLRRAQAHGDVVAVAGHGNVGYAGGINVGIAHLGDVEAVLVLNADVTVEPGAVAALVARLARSEAGIVLPLTLDDRGAVAPSVRREPTVLRALGDAVLGRFFGDRPGWLSEIVRDPTCYAWPHPVEWGAGAALLIRMAAVRSIGPWDERFFLYSEETDYCRRAREAGWEVWFEPAARVRHAGGGSGHPPQLTALLQVNRVRYARKHRSPIAAVATLAVTTIGSMARTWHAGHRSAVGALLLPARRRALPCGPSPVTPAGHGPDDLHTGVRGTVVIPAHDEAAVISRALAPIAPWALDVGVDVVVVCNGCTDGTADVARRFPGVRVLELAESSKILALNAGDQAARTFPRIYADADVCVDPAAMAATLRALSDGSWLAARPPAEVDAAEATAPVRAFYRARRRLASTQAALWGAGIYGLSERGHARLGTFPPVLADDLWVDELFQPAEKVVVDAPPVHVAGPRTVPSLLLVLRRTYRGNAALTAPSKQPGRSTTRRTLRELAHTIHGPQSAVDAGVYAALVTLGRVQRRDHTGVRWERDESTRR